MMPKLDPSDFVQSSPLPFKAKIIDDGVNVIIRDANGRDVAIMVGEVDKRAADAQLIVLAINEKIARELAYLPKDVGLPR